MAFADADNATVVPSQVVVGADHAGFELKDKVKEWLEAAGCRVLDVGTNSAEAVDYPDIARRVATIVSEGEAERGVLICGSGAGACIAANKVQGVRASVAHDTYSAHQAVEHDDMNVLCLGSRIVGEALAKDLVETWLRARFSNEERHVRRLSKVKEMDART